MRTKTHRRFNQGVTLVELLIVVAIVGILGTIAVANYRGHVIRSNRAEATAALLRIQVAQEKYYLSRNTYANNVALLGLGSTTERGLYTLQIADGANAAGYTAQATAAGSQVSDTECQTMSIDQTGRRLPTPGTTSRCWQ
jgi:type IV pilus assembly protein PilE